MATTLATDKQAVAIKQRMAEIRTDLPYAADVARERVKELADWKYHVAKHPLPILAAAAAAGYLLVPHKQSRRSDAKSGELVDGNPVPQPASKSLLGGIAGALATVLIKQATSMATHHVTHLISQRGDT
jgi:hypothetical protein